MAQMILYLCRDTNTKVLNILTEISKKEDVTEFITTIQLVQITINNLLKSKREFKFEALKELQNALKDYETLLGQLNGTGKLLRFLTNSRLRRKLEQSNGSIHEKLETFKKSIHGANAPNSNPSMRSTESQISLNAQNATNASEDVAEDEVESTVKLSLMIENQDGKDLWAELFGLDQFMIPWDMFAAGLRKLLTEITHEEETVLQYIIDNANTGLVSQHKFSELMKGFGQIHDAIQNAKSVLSSKWFYGFLTRIEVDLLLRDQPVGTFLIRFSSSQPGSFALAFSVLASNGEKSIVHILITSCGPMGFQVQEQENQTARTFANLHEIVDFYSIFLQIPFNSTTPFESWFEGDYSSPEAQEALTGQKPGTFIVRFSSQPGAYAVSFVTMQGQITHSLIEHESVPNGGYRIVNEGQPIVFPSLTEVIKFYGDSLKYPFKAITNELQVEAARVMLQWKRERLKQMESVDQIVHDLFDTSKQLPLDKSQMPEDGRVAAIVSRLFENV